MGKVFAWIGGSIVFLVCAFVCFWVWCDVKHDKTAFEFIKDKLDKQEEVVEDTTTEEDEIVVENEDETVTATALISW